MKIKKTIRIEEDSDAKIKELIGMTGAKSENELIERAISQLYENQISTEVVENNYDKVEELLANSFSLLIRKSNEEIATMMNQINHNNNVQLIMLEMILQATSTVPEDLESAKEVIKKNLVYRSIAEEIYMEEDDG